MSPFTSAAMVAAALLGAHHASAQTTYTFKTFKAPMMGSTIFEAVNNGGAILAEVSASGSTTCMLRAGGTQTVIADPSAASTATYCNGVDKAGDVVGFYLLASGATVGFIYSGGGYTDFTVPAASVPMGGTQLTGVSKNGLFTGTYADENGFYHAFTTRGGSIRHIAISGENYVIPTGVDDAGDIAAQTFDADGNLLGCYFVSKAGTATTIAFPNSTRTVVHGVNTQGQVAGHYSDSQGLEHGFIYDSASNTYAGPIDAPANTGGTLLFGVNDAGKVVGATTPNPTTSIRLGLVGTP